ncbi:MAG: hypothetical protein HZB29_14055 [Nitrospinae bacterium]|nr:hypothetical protein [Nitrospinota bacterium]
MTGCLALFFASSTAFCEDNAKARSLDQIASDINLRLEYLRLEMGKPPVPIPEVAIEGESPRERYHLASSLFNKANILYFEWLHDIEEHPPAPEGPIMDTHVADLLSRVYSLLEKSRVGMGLPKNDSAAGQPVKCDFAFLLSANRRLNGLLINSLAPRNAFQQVSLAVKHAARLIARFPGVERIPPAEPMPRRKIPADVHARLLKCLGMINELDRRSGMKPFVIKSFDFKGAVVDPSDVYDLAFIIVSELDHLHQQTPGARNLPSFYFPETKFPSQVFQRAGILEAQLKILDQMTAADPNWLKGER